MAMICPKCQEAYKQRLQCPNCKVRLEYHAGGRSLVTNKPGDPRRGGWQETPWGRIAVGLLLAQGLYYGLWHLGNAGLLGLGGEEAGAFWTTMPGLLVIQGLQALALLLGGALAGAGRQRGIMFGALVGVWNGLLFLVMHTGQKDILTPVALYGQPLLQTAFGAIGGAIGRFIWKPLPSVSQVFPVAKSSGLTPVPSKLSVLLRGPVAWVRVLIGSVIAIIGAMSAEMVLDFVVDAGQGKLTVETHLQARLITWEITALAAVAGAAVAGANTRNGFKQGLCVGILTCVVLVGIALGKTRLDLFGVVLTIAIALPLSVGGGWFGSNLFPPLRADHYRKKPSPVTA